VLFTSDACISAHVATVGERVKDVLNSPAAILELANLTYSNPDRPGLPLVDYPSGVVRKADVTCVIVLSEPPAEAIRKIGVYIQKRPIALSVLVPGMVIVGTIHVQGRFNPVSLLTDPPELFIPLTEAGIVRSRTTTPTAIAAERLTIFVNRAHVNGIMLADIDDPAITADQMQQRFESHATARGTGMLAQPAVRPTGSLGHQPVRGTGPISALITYGPGHVPVQPRDTSGLQSVGTADWNSPDQPRVQTGRLRRFTESNR
jgi:hypothetical protein